jgi:hypothetical protein
MFLYHFSEEPNISIFVPRFIEGKEDPHPLIWAIDEEHSVNYLFPRDCPRIIYSRSERISEEDEERYFFNTSAKTIITVESAWIEQINGTTLYKYTFSDNSFELLDETAGYYVSKQTINPYQVEPVVDLIEEILKRGVELRFTPNLYPLRDSILKSTVDDFSIIRFRNAQKP